MLRKSARFSFGCVVVLLAACSEDGTRGSSNNAGAAGEATHHDAGASGGGSAGNAGAPSGGSGGAGRAGSSASGGPSAGGGRPRPDSGSSDAASDHAMTDAASDVTAPPVCLGVQQACGTGTTACCEAYACTNGKCCVPTGVWSNCLTNSDCCSNSCILNQCTCVPRGYSCNGPGQCCSGFACVNGTCICPPDIRGC
jgi:hypothetical protein